MLRRAVGTAVAMGTAVLVMVGAIATNVVGADAGPATLSRAVGVYVGGGDREGAAAFESWLGAPVPVVEDFLAGGSWDEIASPGWFVDRWAGTDRTLVLGVPMLPPSGASLAQGATGAYNGYFDRLARGLVSHGRPDAILRIGWEFNGGWYPWRAKPDPVAFAGYWRQIVTTMRAVPGAAFRFDWNPTLGINDWTGSTPFRAESAYPGDAYVDFVGVDVYDQSWSANGGDPDVRWNEIYAGDHGLRFWRDFANAHGKPLSLPEWGVSRRDDGHGGGDAPSFIERVHDFVATENVAYHVYFEFNASDGDHCLTCDTQFARSAARYRELFGAPTPQPDTASSLPVTRVAGASRVETAVEASRTRLSQGSASAVVVARDDELADALAAGPLAAVNGGPVLLTPRNAAGAATVSEASRVLAPGGTVYLLGGVDALTPPVEDGFARAGLRTRREGGGDRYAPATLVASLVNPAPEQVFLASGVSLADAIVAGAAAGRLRAPIVLTDRDALPPATRSYLASVTGARLTVIGGTAVVSDAVARGVGTADRVAGADRYETAADIAQRWFSSAAALAVAQGARLADPLVAAPAGEPVLLVSPTAVSAARDYVRTTATSVARMTVYGGPDAVSDSILGTLLS